MKLTEIDIHELLPQQAPFVMVGRLDRCDREQTVTTTLVKADNLFVSNGAMQPAGVIENIAQSCAAGQGYVNKYLLPGKVRIGYIGAIRNLKIHRLPLIGETVTTTIHIVENLFGMSLIEARMTSGDDLLAEGSMKIALAPDNAADTDSTNH